MRHLILGVLLFASCKSSPVADCNLKSFDEKDYKLIDSNKDDLGNKYSELYVNKQNSEMQLKKIFWENGKVQSSVFFSRGNKLSGPGILFDSSGTMIYEGFYFEDKPLGVTIQYDAQSKKAIIKTYGEGGQVVNQQNVN